MARKARKLITMIFFAATLASTIVIGYSLTHYVGVSLAIRSTSASVKDFRVEFVGEDRVIISTNVAVNNPSPYQLTWLWVEVNVYVNQTRAGTTYEIFSESNPFVVLPQAETNHTLKIQLHLTLVRPEIAKWLMNPATTKNWVAVVDAYCEAPLAGTVKMSTTASMETH